MLRRFNTTYTTIALAEHFASPSKSLELDWFVDYRFGHKSAQHLAVASAAAKELLVSFLLALKILFLREPFLFRILHQLYDGKPLEVFWCCPSLAFDSLCDFHGLGFCAGFERLASLL